MLRLGSARRPSQKPVAALAALTTIALAACGPPRPVLTEARVVSLHPPPLEDVRLPTLRTVPAPLAVSAFGRVDQQADAALHSDIASLNSQLDQATTRAATDSNSGSVDQPVQDDLKRCAKAGLVAVGRDSFTQFLNGTTSFNHAASAGIKACLTKAFPGADPDLIANATDGLVRLIDPSAAQAQKDSPNNEAFQAWLRVSGGGG